MVAGGHRRARHAVRAAQRTADTELPESRRKRGAASRHRNLRAFMPAPTRSRRVSGEPYRLVVASLSVLCYVLAFLQRPGRTFTDTRIELSVDPVHFLHSVASVWSSTEDLGHVQSGQFVGYLAPMAPWYAFAHAIGMPTWIAERIWLGSLLALAAWGTVRLLETLLDQRAGLTHFAAGLLFVANPYVVVAIGRATVVLLAYAALPWLLLFTHRGLRNAWSWRAPAAIGLVFALSGGGVNAALLFWIAIAPIGLVLYEVVVLGSATWSNAFRFSLRAVVCVVVASLWWVVPVLLQTRYGADFLKFTEQPFAIFATPSLSESLRLLGYWLVYFGIGQGPFHPVVGAAGVYLFNPLVIAATFAVPLIAFAGLLRTRHWIYAPFFVVLAMGTLIIMSLGFPPGSPMNRILATAYFHVGALQSLRTTWKAAPLLALPLASLGGMAANAIASAARPPNRLRIRRLTVPVWAPVGLLVFPVLWALPLFTGTAVDANTVYGSVPKYWRAAITDAAKATNANQRIMILPGELFGWYRWGGTTDSIAPSLTSRSVLVRETTRYADPRASQLLTSIDDLVQQDRLVPGQLNPLLGLLGVRSVLVPTDGNLPYDGALDPARVATALRDQPEFAHPVQSYGRPRGFAPPAGRSGPAVVLPDVRRYAVGSGAPGIVRAAPIAHTTILDGDGNGIAELAAERELNPNLAIVYAADLGRRETDRLVTVGARLVFTDSNRLRIVGPTSLRTNVGPTLGPGDPIAPDTPTYDLFPQRDPASRTVASYSGLVYLRTPGLHPSAVFLPENGPYAALDGQLSTAWLADAQAPLSKRYLELRLASPHPVASIDIYPLREQLGDTTEVALSVNGGPERLVRLSAGWNKVPIGAAPLRTLRVRITGVIGLGTAGGISELRIPGVRASQALRLPTILATVTRGLDLRHNTLTVLLARTTADFPYRERPLPGDLQALSALHETDAESGIKRIVTLPVARAFGISGWASVTSSAPDQSLDRLVGLPSGWTFSSSNRFEGVPLRRASSAFDQDPLTAWVAPFLSRYEFPWIQWSAPNAMMVRRLHLSRGPADYEFPALVRVSAPGAQDQDLAVSAAGDVTLPHPIRTRTLRLQVLSVRFPLGQFEFSRFLDAVAIGEISVPGLNPPAPRRTGTFATPCGALTIASASASVRLQVYGPVSQLDRGDALPVRACGTSRALPLSAGPNAIVSAAGPVMAPDHLALNSPAPAPLPTPLPKRIGSSGIGGQGWQRAVRPGVAARVGSCSGRGIPRGGGPGAATPPATSTRSERRPRSTDTPTDG